MTDDTGPALRLRVMVLFSSMSKAGQLLSLALPGILLSGGCAAPALLETTSGPETRLVSMASADNAATISASNNSKDGEYRRPEETIERRLVDRGYSESDAEEIRQNLKAMDPNVRALVTGMVLALSSTDKQALEPPGVLLNEDPETSSPQTIPHSQERLPQERLQETVRNAISEKTPISTATVLFPNSEPSAEPDLFGQDEPPPPDSPATAANSPPPNKALATATDASFRQASTASPQAMTATRSVVSIDSAQAIDQPVASASAIAHTIGDSRETRTIGQRSILESDEESDEESDANRADDEQALNWRKQLRQTVARLRQQLQEEPPDDDNERARMQTYLSMLYLVAEDKDEAMEVLQDLSDEELEFWRQTIMGLGVLLNPDDLPRFRHRVDSATDHFRQGVSSLSTLGSLRLKNLTLCSKVTGFGDFEEFPSYAFRPGSPIILYVEVDNFCVDQVGAIGEDRHRSARRRSSASSNAPVFQTELHGRYEILDMNQRPVASRILPVDRNQCHNHRRDYFIPYTLFVPEKIAAGYYTLELTIEDKKGDKFGNAVIDIQVK